MDGKDLMYGMGFVDNKFVEEAEFITRIKRISLSWRYYFAAAACFIFVISMAMLIPNISDTPDTQPDNEPTLPHQTSPTPYYPEIYQVDMSQILVNDIHGISEGSFLYDPKLHEIVTWTMDEIVAYYGKNPVPAYIPDILTASPYNESATVLVDKSGAAVNDVVHFDFYHAYDNNGNPLLDAGSGTKMGFSVAVSKIGTINDCVYADTKNLETTYIGGTAVILGSMSTPYELYTAEFEYEDIHYLIIAEQMQLEEVVKVVASVIFESENILINYPGTPVSEQDYGVREPEIESRPEESSDNLNNPVSEQSYSVDEPEIESRPEESSDNLNNPVSEQNYDVGKPVMEGCYDDPNNPVANQDYSVGEPNNE